jgi:hypothetical protein
MLSLKFTSFLCSLLYLFSEIGPGKCFQGLSMHTIDFSQEDPPWVILVKILKNCEKSGKIRFFGTPCKTLKSQISGLYVTPSYVSYSNNGILVGEVAKKQLLANPQNTIYGKCFKRCFLDNSEIPGTSVKRFDRALIWIYLWRLTNREVFKSHFESESGDKKLRTLSEAQRPDFTLIF